MFSWRRKSDSGSKWSEIIDEGKEGGGGGAHHPSSVLLLMPQWTGSFILLSGESLPSSSPPTPPPFTSPLPLSLLVFVLFDNGAIRSEGVWRGEGAVKEKERWCWSLVLYGEVVQVNRGPFSPLCFVAASKSTMRGFVCFCVCVSVCVTLNPTPPPPKSPAHFTSSLMWKPKGRNICNRQNMWK